MISSSVEGRELVMLGGGGVLLHGTHHKVPDEETGATRPAKDTGVLFLNALSTPRSLVGESGVYWATSFAARGYPSFRFDLPGLGDSYGEVPNDLVKYADEGGWAPVASSKVKELVQSRQLPGVVMFGHCSGATTAIYAASQCRECKGLILLDPYFNLPRSLTPSLRPGLVLWVRRSKTGAILRTGYDRVRQLREKFHKETLPANANLPLISRVKKVLSSGLPILIFKAPRPPLREGEFDYFEYVISLAVRENQFTVKTIEDTDHSFSNRAGRLAVRQHCETWLGEHF